MKKLFFSLTVAVALFQLSSCAKKEGCTDPSAPNYNADAEKDNGSCIDETEDIVGSYTGDFVFVDENGDETTFADETIIITKINRSSISIDSESGEIPSFDAEIAEFNASYTTFDIPVFTFDGYEVEGSEQSANGITAEGGVQDGEILFGLEATDGSVSATFSGTKD